MKDKRVNPNRRALLGVLLILVLLAGSALALWLSFKADVAQATVVEAVSLLLVPVLLIGAGLVGRRMLTK